MKIDEFKKYKKVLIIGRGLEGKSAEAFFRKNYPGIELKVTDIKDGPDYLSLQSNFELAVKSPGVNKKFIEIPYTTPTNIFFANAKAPTIGITGTKGKSTTTSLIHAIFKEAGYDARLCGNIGKPMLDQLLEPVNEKTIYVVELSSYQLDDIKYSPHISLILNLFPEHMDYHGSFDAYKEAKKNIARFSEERDYFVFNSSSDELSEYSKAIKAKPTPIPESVPIARSEVPLAGDHNYFNVKAAYAVAKIMNVSDKVIESAVKKFIALPHRLEKVGTFKGITFYDDAISTTPESTIQALDALPDVQTIFLGGLNRGYDFTMLAEKVAKSGIKNIVLFPDSGSQIKEALKHANKEFKYLETRDMEEAVRWAYEVTSPGSICLLSCASPSYSVWKNFEEKGGLFKEFVTKLGQ